MLLLELFNAPYDFSDIVPEKNEVDYKFKNKDNIPYEIAFIKRPNNIYSIIFDYDLVPRKALAVEKEGVRDIRVLSTVVRAIKDFVAARPDVRAIHFRVNKLDADSKEKLYNMMMAKLVPDNYEVEFKPTMDKTEANYLIHIR